MPKRKREPVETDHVTRASKVNGERNADAKTYETELERILDNGKQLLINALKLCQRFERQKLSRRSRKAITEKDDKETERIEEEVKALNVCPFNR
jgi:hypothetical protein